MKIEPVILDNAFLYNADCRDVLASLPDNSVDSIVTDPPYELGFMGKGWDSTGIAYDVAMWREALRVLKPGGHLLSFGGSRTYHRMACAIEDAGFEIRDQVMWIYGSGFPKSHNLEGDWDGWGTALKPAHEPIVVARKPLIGTVAQNVAAHGTGALNIDGCRVEHNEVLREGAGGIPCRNDESAPRRPGEASSERRYTEAGGTNFAMQPGQRGGDPQGRWPANVIHDGSDEVVAHFPKEAGAFAPVLGTEPSNKTKSVFSQINRQASNAFHGDRGSAARFFYCAKVDREERNEGCEQLPQRTGGMVSNTSGQHITRRDEGYEAKPQGNIHPTVKPIALIRYLWRLVTPPGGTGLDLFMGSGSHGVAAVLEGFGYIGCESDTEHGYFDISVARVKHATTIPQQKELFA